MQKKLGAIKKTEYDQLVKKVNVVQTTDTSNLAKKTDYNKEVNESEKKLTECNHKCISTQEFNKLELKNVARTLAQGNDVADFVKKTDFDDELRNLN